MGSWTQGVRVGGAKRLGEGRGGSEGVQNVLFTAFHIHEWTHKSL